MSSRPGRRILIAADDLDEVPAQDPVFVERPAIRASGLLTYGDLLTAADCASIDDQAYAEARAWHRSPDASDPLTVDGISYGAATEYAATEALVRYYRARMVLGRLAEDSPNNEVELRAVGPEWQLAADALGLRWVARHIPPYRPSPSGLTYPTASERLLARVERRSPRPGSVVIMGGPKWFVPYHRSIARSRAVHLVDPGLRVLASQLASFHAGSAEWLTDAGQLVVHGAVVDRGGHELPRLFAPALQPLLRGLPEWTRAGARAARYGARVAVAPQDALPAIRAYLIGFRAAGGRIVTLEHGVAGSFRNQIHSVAHTLAVWGAPQQSYHSARQPAGLRFAPIGSARMARFWALRDRPTRRAKWDLLFFAQPTTALSAGSWPADEVRAVRLVETYSRRHPGRRVAMKLHPATRTYGGFVAPDSPVERVQGDALDLIASARVVAVATSTAGIEAMAAGVPVLELRPAGPAGEPSFVSQSGATVVVATDEEFDAGAEALIVDGPLRARAIRTGREYAYTFVRGIDDPGLSERLLREVVEAEWEATD